MSTVDLITGAVTFYEDIQGTSAQWSDGSDATWATAVSRVGYNSSAGQSIDLFTGDPSTVSGFQLTVRCAVTAPAGAPATMPLTWAFFPGAAYPGPGPGGYWTVSTDGVPHDYSVTLTDANLAAAVAAEQVEYDIGFHVHDFGGTDYGSTPLTGTYQVTIYEASVIVTYALAPTGLPPLRQYPRSDGLGVSSARRAWPPAPSVQGSIRRVGGYS